MVNEAGRTIRNELLRKILDLVEITRSLFDYLTRNIYLLSAITELLAVHRSLYSASVEPTRSVLTAHYPVPARTGRNRACTNTFTPAVHPPSVSRNHSKLGI